MIKVKVNYDGDYIKSFKITGHANYDVHGKDIVCASASSIVITSINASLSINDKSIKVEEKDGLIDAKVLVKDQIVNKILTNMLNMLIELQNDYKDNIKII